MTKFEIPKSEGIPNVENGEKQLTVKMSVSVGIPAE